MTGPVSIRTQNIISECVNSARNYTRENRESR